MGIQPVQAKTIEILLVEDNPGDVLLLKETFKQSKAANHITVAEDGTVAMDILHRTGKYADAVAPDIIILDLHLPKKDGREVLAELKEDTRFRSIPVIILTTSQAREDVIKCYQLHANCYITKPFDLEDFIAMVESFENFWFSKVRLPF
jgi:chemotaxis family two-component system response regulator Rcp1